MGFAVVWGRFGDGWFEMAVSEDWCHISAGLLPLLLPAVSLATNGPSCPPESLEDEDMDSPTPLLTTIVTLGLVAMSSTVDPAVLWSTTARRRIFTPTHPPLPEKEFYSAATAMDNHRLLVVGGSKGPSSADNSCGLYDTRTRTWSTDWPHLNIAISWHTCIRTNDNKVYVVGGGNSNDGRLDSMERYGCRAIAHPKNPNSIIVVGGHDNEDKYLSCCVISLQQTQEGETRRLPSMMTPRFKRTLVLVDRLDYPRLVSFKAAAKTVRTDS